MMTEEGEGSSDNQKSNSNIQHGGDGGGGGDGSNTGNDIVLVEEIDMMTLVPQQPPQVNASSSGALLVASTSGSSGSDHNRSSYNGSCEQDSLRNDDCDDDEDDLDDLTTTEQSASDEASESRRLSYQLTAESTQESTTAAVATNAAAGAGGGDASKTSSSTPLEHQRNKSIPVSTQQQHHQQQQRRVSTNTTTASPFSLYNHAVMVSDQSRNEIHSKFRAYEARRRSTYTAKLESSSLYWRSFRDLLQASIHETARAERIVLGTSKAYDRYAQAMQAMYEDVFIDDKGHVVPTSRAQQQLAKQRQLQQQQQQQQESSPSSSSDGTMLLSMSLSHSSTHNNHSKKDSTILGSLIDSQSVMAQRFRENSEHVELQVSQDIAQLKMEMQQKIHNIESMGNVIIAELEKTEQLVQQAWDSYYTTSLRGLGSGGSGMSSNLARRAGAVVLSSAADYEDNPLSPSNNTTTTGMISSSSSNPSSIDYNNSNNNNNNNNTNTIVDNCSDVWLVEMHYRVAVQYQTATWEKGSTELSKLFTIMKIAECQRRIHLRECLLQFVQRQQKLFLGLPDVHTPVLQDLVGRQMDPTAVEEQVQQAIRKRAHVLQQQRHRQQQKGGGGGGGGMDNSSMTSVMSPPPILPGDSSVSSTIQKQNPQNRNTTTVTKDKTKTKVDQQDNDEDGSKLLESPLTSGLLCRAKVIEKKSAGMMQGWKTALAVVTADSFLHLFDLPPNSSVKPGTAPEVAFATFLPQVVVPDTSRITTVTTTTTSTSNTDVGPSSATTTAGGSTSFSAKGTKLLNSFADHPLTPSDSLALANCSITTSIQDIKWCSFEVTERVYNKGATKVFSKTALKSFKLRMLTRAEMEEWISVLQSQK